MKASQKYIGFLIAAAALIFSGRLEAANVTVTSYYPSLHGQYEQLRLHPRSHLSNPCTIGSLYVNADNLLQFCQDNAGTGAWGAVSDYWTQIGNNIYLTDSLTNPDLFVGIGTKTPQFKLSLIDNAGIIAKGTFGDGAVLPELAAGSQFIWYPRKAALRAGHVDGDQWDDGNIGDYSMAMGKNSTASGDYSNVGGGDGNTASGDYSNVIGGRYNVASGNYSAVTGGYENTASGDYSIVIGGNGSRAASHFSTIHGGQGNQVQADAIYGTIGGGSANLVYTPYSNINGGENNVITLLGGTTPAGYSVIGGGYDNITHSDNTVISGGMGHRITAPYVSIGGGSANYAGKAVTGGGPITYLGMYSRISGGESNHIAATFIGEGDYATISGGKNNDAEADYATIGGGESNTVTADYSVIGGGARNIASGQNAMIMGGSDNLAAGNYSWAEGKNIKIAASASGTFAWGYSDTPVNITNANTFIIAPGTLSGGGFWNPKVGVRDSTPAAVLEINANNTAEDYLNIKNTGSGDIIFLIKNNGAGTPYIGIGRPTPEYNDYLLQVGTNGTNGNGAYLDAGGHWLPVSSRATKENIEPLSLESAESALDQMQPVTFNYKVTPEHTNVGFIAEDVPELVAMNGHDKLSAMDIVAVLTKIAQDQEKQIAEQSQRIEMIKTEIRTLKKMRGEQ